VVGTDAAGASPHAAQPVEAVKVLRTPEARFENPPDYPFTPHYAEIDAGDDAGTRLRVHYVDERPSDPTKASGQTVLLLPGEPSWSYLYRHVIPPLVAAGHRCIAPDPTSRICKAPADSRCSSPSCPSMRRRRRTARHGRCWKLCRPRSCARSATRTTESATETKYCGSAFRALLHNRTP
jgi:hypothetical protein